MSTSRVGRTECVEPPQVSALATRRKPIWMEFIGHGLQNRGAATLVKDSVGQMIETERQPYELIVIKHAPELFCSDDAREFSGLTTQSV